MDAPTMTLCDCYVDAPPLTLYDCGIFAIHAVIGAIIHKYFCPWRPGSRLTPSQIKDALVQLRPIFYADKVRTGAPYERHREATRKLNDYIYTQDERALQWLGEYTAEGGESGWEGRYEAAPSPAPACSPGTNASSSGSK